MCSVADHKHAEANASIIPFDGNGRMELVMSRCSGSVSDPLVVPSVLAQAPGTHLGTDPIQGRGSASAFQTHDSSAQISCLEVLVAQAC